MSPRQFITLAVDLWSFARTDINHVLPPLGYWRAHSN